MKKQSLTEQTAKNSIYNMSSTIISRVGGLILTIILARFLLPELFGIYSLVLSLALIITNFTDLGISTTLVRYVSAELGKNNRKKATAYIHYLFKFRFYLVTGIILLLIILAEFISNTIFQKPEIYYPLLFISLYILMKLFFSFFKSFFNALKDFKKIAIMQFVSEISRILLILIALLFLSKENIVSGIFIALSIGFFITSLLAFIISDKKLIFQKSKKQEKEINKKRIFSYLGFVSLVSISMTFFGSIDTLMLGRFVEAEFIGYYHAALSLVGSAAAIFAFGGVFLPIFTQIHNKRLQRGFSKSFKYTLLLTIPSLFGVVLIGKYFILAIYGTEYLMSSLPLIALSFMILLSPLIALYTALFQAKEKPQILAKHMIISVILNIILNYFLIKTFLSVSQQYAIFGAGIATVLSRGIYLGFLIFKTKTKLNLSTPFKEIIKPLISSIIMAGFILLFNSIIDMNWIFGIIEVVLATGIYFLVLFLIKGLDMQDIKLFKGIFVRRFGR